MKASNFPIFTLKDTPSEAEILSHKLMIKSGIVRKLSSGLYSWLPIGVRIISKIKKIVREEMHNIGCSEISMPLIQPSELWKESERWDQYGPELLRISDRHDREFCFGPTFEEVITDLIRKEVSSYKQLPMNLFQITAKFRDEIRPRFGVMRAREFIMKDAYSFHDSKNCLNKTYEKYKSAYKNIFDRLSLKYTIVEADSGNIGGNESHEFHVLANNGEDDLLISDSNEGMNVEIAKIKYKNNDINKIIKENKLNLIKGIEVGHIFKLDDKYTSKMKAEITLKDSKITNILMGCYGIGITRIAAAAIEQSNDEKGIIWPKSISPFDIAIVQIDASEDQKVKEVSNSIYADLLDKNFDVILDDRNLKLGSKLNDWELIGIPYVIIIGSREIKSNKIILMERTIGKKIEVDIGNILKILKK